jgi:hypothetical protein
MFNNIRFSKLVALHIHEECSKKISIEKLGSCQQNEPIGVFRKSENGVSDKLQNSTFLTWV